MQDAAIGVSSLPSSFLLLPLFLCLPHCLTLPFPTISPIATVVFTDAPSTTRPTTNAPTNAPTTLLPDDVVYGLLPSPPPSPPSTTAIDGVGHRRRDGAFPQNRASSECGEGPPRRRGGGPPTYEERRATIERSAIEERRRRITTRATGGRRRTRRTYYPYRVGSDHSSRTNATATSGRSSRTIRIATSVIPSSPTSAGTTYSIALCRPMSNCCESIEK